MEDVDEKLKKGESFIMLLEDYENASSFHNAYCNNCNYDEREYLEEKLILESVYDIGQD